MLLRHAAVVGVLFAVASWPLPAQDDEAAAERARFIRSSYRKFEVKIPMRDGVELFTAIYAPNDTSREVPILLLRTPYSVGPYGASRYRTRLGPTPEFEKAGMIFVFQDVRGRYMSGGEFVNMRPHIADKRPGQIDESTDTYDTIAWLLEHLPGHNGKVGLWGISYPGFYASAGMIDSHPALVAVSPQAPIADWYWDDMHHNGAFILPLAFNFFASFGVPREGPTVVRPDRFDHGTPDGYQFFLDLGPLSNANARYFHGDIAFWNEIVAHPDYDAFWQSRNIVPHLRNVRAAVLVVGGLFDTEDLYGPLATYAAVERNNPRADNRLVMGPWPHGGWIRTRGDKLGEAEFGFATSEDFQRRMLWPFFAHHLLGESAPALAEATVFETGANRWREFDAWPPPQRTEAALYLREGGTLSYDPPNAPEPAADAYPSDPAKPVPYTAEITARWARDYMTEDQRFAARRPDVLVYRSEPLADDVTLAGPIEADVWFSTDRTAADVIVKLIDEYPGRLGDLSDEEKATYPGGRQMLVRAEVMRGRYRESFTSPRPFVPGEPARVRFRLLDVLHTFQRGHRITIQIQSTWFPFVDRNPQTFVPNIFEAKPEDFVPATHRIHRSAEHPSRIVVGILPQLGAAHDR